MSLNECESMMYCCWEPHLFESTHLPKFVRSGEPNFLDAAIS